MAKIKQIGKTKVYQFICKGCNCTHNINCNSDLHGAWSYTSGANGPTFKPSLKIVKEGKVCQFTIADGQITYDQNCFHKLAGQTIELPEIKNTL
jgi:hypothetical protein